MFLFLHDLGATNSLWIPTIRHLLGEKSNEYSDKELKDIFTLQLPGHGNRDKYFEMLDIHKEILKFQEDNLHKQNQIADTLLLNNNMAFINSLRSKKLVLIGHCFGAMVALDFAIKQQKQAEKLVLIGLGAKFSRIGILLKTLEYKKLDSKKRYQLQQEIENSQNLRYKILLSHFLENPVRRSYKTGFKLIKKYNFKKIFKQLTISQQIELATLPILAIGGKLDRNTRFSSIQEIENILTSKIPKEFQEEEDKQSQKKTVINKDEASQEENSQSKIEVNFKIVLYNQSDDSPMDKYPNEVADDLRKFLEKGKISNLTSIQIDKTSDIIF
jgi:pimeloyl-ACP methyl ester carboxylesterase